MRDTLAVILAGGEGSRLQPLTLLRAKPAVPFGSKYRIIDPSIQNCLNSDIRKILVLTQYAPGSLVKHISEFWIPLMGLGGSLVPLGPKMRPAFPGEQRFDGTADAVNQHMDAIVDEHSGIRFVAILSGDQIYKLDIGKVVSYHKEKGSRFTVCAHVVPRELAANAYGVIDVDDKYRVVRFLEKPPLEKIKGLKNNPNACLASMGDYIIDVDLLADELEEDASKADSEHDFGKSIIPQVHAKGIPIYVYPLNLNVIDGQPDFYWRDVGSLDQYYVAQNEMLWNIPPINLIHEAWRMYTYPDGLPAARNLGRNTITQSNYAGGCIIERATLEWTSLGRSVVVKPGAELVGSHFFDNIEIGENVKCRKVICDKKVVIPDNEVIGYDHVADGARGMHIEWLNETEWLTVIPKGYKNF